MHPAKLIVCTLLAACAFAAHALEVKPYSAAALAAAEKADKPVALHFHADWCPTCRAQDGALKKLEAQGGLDLTVLVVNYDTEKALKREFNIRTQATFVVMRGHKETARLVGDTSADDIRTALKSAL